MGSSGSKSESGSSGSDWTGKLYYDPAADKSGPNHPIANDELRTKLKELVDPKEKILSVEIYRHPLNSWQLSSILWYHAFVLFETDGWWWSIEKNTEGLTIQRSKKIDSVLENYRRTKRVTTYLEEINLVLSTKCDKTVEDLVNFLYNKNHLTEEYSFLVRNCKHFSAAVYNHLRPVGSKRCTIGVMGGLFFADLP